MAVVADIPKAMQLQTTGLAVVAAAPLVVAPTCVLVLGSAWAEWQRMVGVAIAVYAAAKWLTFAEFVWRDDARRNAPLPATRIAGCLLLWPGMNPRPFFASSASAPRPLSREWLAAIVKLCGGMALLAIAARLATTEPHFAGWLGVAGFLLALHFGSFHLLSLAWRAAGVSVEPIMNAPLVATSLAGFWGRRWNLAFRDLAHRFVFRPVVGLLGPAVATLLVFLMSGLAHDAVVSLPVDGGYGGPTTYFLLQGLAMLVERTAFARRIGLGRGFIGRAFTLAVVLAPAALLFHRPFIERAIVPLLVALPF